MSNREHININEWINKDLSVSRGLTKAQKEWHCAICERVIFKGASYKKISIFNPYPNVMARLVGYNTASKAHKKCANIVMHEKIQLGF